MVQLLVRGGNLIFCSLIIFFFQHNYHNYLFCLPGASICVLLHVLCVLLHSFYLHPAFIQWPNCSHLSLHCHQPLSQQQVGMGMFCIQVGKTAIFILRCTLHVLAHPQGGYFTKSLVARFSINKLEPIRSKVL